MGGGKAVFQADTDYGIFCLRIFGFRLMDMIPRTRLAALSFLVTGGSLFLATFAESNVFFIGCAIAYGIAMGFGFPLHLSLIGDAVSERPRPKATAMVWFLMSGCFLSPPSSLDILRRCFLLPGPSELLWVLLLLPRPLSTGVLSKHRGLRLNPEIW